MSSEGRGQERVGGGEEGVRAGGEVGQSPRCHGLSCQDCICVHTCACVCVCVRILYPMCHAVRVFCKGGSS